jgi:hypothetical protein
MTIPLEQFEYQDPLKVLLRKEGGSCKGCIHEEKVSGFGTSIWICVKRDHKNKVRRHGTRCKEFKGRGAG